MTTARKVQILHAIAHGQSTGATKEELREVKKYRVGDEDAFFATNANLKAYVNDVDSGKCHKPFYDWAIENRKADRRLKGSSEADIAAGDKDRGIASMFMGCACWSLAIYWMLDETMSVGGSIILGAVVGLVLYKISRKWAPFTVFLLPLILVGYFH